MVGSRLVIPPATTTPETFGICGSLTTATALVLLDRAGCPRHAVVTHKARVMIVDWDYHHGNGTQGPGLVLNIPFLAGLGFHENAAVPHRFLNSPVFDRLMDQIFPFHRSHLSAGACIR